MHSRIFVIFSQIVLSYLWNTHQLQLHLYLLLNVTLIVVQDAIYVQTDAYVPYKYLYFYLFPDASVKLVLLRLKNNSLINTGWIIFKS